MLFVGGWRWRVIKCSLMPTKYSSILVTILIFIVKPTTWTCLSFFVFSFPKEGVVIAPFCELSLACLVSICAAMLISNYANFLAIHAVLSSAQSLLGLSTEVQKSQVANFIIWTAMQIEWSHWLWFFSKVKWDRLCLGHFLSPSPYRVSRVDPNRSA